MELVVMELFFAGLLGAVLGSFYHLCASRYGTGRGVVFGRSCCTACRRTLYPAELIPLLSFALQRGRCKGCGAAIGWASPLTEAVSALLAMLLLLEKGVSPAFAFGMVCCGFMLVASAIDLEHQILPDGCTLGGAAAALALSPWGGPGLTDSLMGAAFGAGTLYLLRLFFLLVRKREALGLGDVKYLLFIGAAVGWQGLPMVFLVSALSGMAALFIFCACRQADVHSTPLPFGPFLSVGCMVCLLYGF